jgi:hypothetical protein
LTLDKDMVTCKRCLKILNKEENSEERAEWIDNEKVYVVGCIWKHETTHTNKAK